ncbi:2-succinyl-5-enolpyruvyl-6-hydroxy-3-cyclohexene-1-carboxylate synthase [Actinomyces bovis]|uniref:2-succinyl-5-enolpyruvyl-6-hydroxy-3-cyclohexene-1-carboxylate synthase n=1 Tax=Actinomyces bovis TaxID=1658 RepID=A0ABY1VNH7_9ACTO|nr:2-succinyl-5-enolpyruvyl-6-hydroxy-3-cyclohexene-1-carboxylic-acid synthase [Actinomyces bovis]SPT53241.1 2-succinyl-5-enolpyruvyl-6-hydroxy-3-cyclohexene-1-carboxylate synthase [Actinomyces bovis]VEG52497.1 2-succinyl-5-enolpyruvyl-6-hydroxy-3-cyclohexene-1-carboxylate synthase [Actinomyces israelii]
MNNDVVAPGAPTAVTPLQAASIQPPSIQAARALVQALVRLGVQHVVLAPGSRCAPLVPVLLAAESAGHLSLRVVLDERSAGFVALGLARADLQVDRRCPAAVVTTSGTAVANLHPAVAEADAAGIPLLIISADRPHELVGTGANQTTEQTRLFGDAPRAVVDLPADLITELGPKAGERAIAGQLRRAVEAARGWLSNDPGPAQVNIRFRPPLAPIAGVDGAVRAAELSVTGPEAGPVPRLDTAAPAAGHDYASRIPRHDGPVRGLVVAGDSVDSTGRRARELAEHLGWPLLAEPTSGARGGPNALIRYAELLGTQAGAALARQVEHIVVFGHPSLTRSVSALLARTDIPIDVVTSTARWVDVAGTATCITSTRLGAEPLRPGGGVRLAAALGLSGAPGRWQACWRDAVAALPPPTEQEGRGSVGPSAARLTADAVATAVWDAACHDAAGGDPRPSADANSNAADRPSAGWADCDPGDLERAGNLPPRLVIGSSMTIRRLDRLAVPPVGNAPHPLANRGLAGIDGTLATATGVALARREPVRVVLGDLAFLHDAMSLSRGRLEHPVDLQVVVVDDAGGAIFSSLEYPDVTPEADFSRCFATPQATDIAALGCALGATVHRPGTDAQLRTLLAAPVYGLSLVHVRP